MNRADLYSKRQQRERGELPDSYAYDDIPRRLRGQIVHIWQDAIGSGPGQSRRISLSQQVYRSIADRLGEEYGVLSLGSGRASERLPEETLVGYFLECDELDQVLDLVELSFQEIDSRIRDNFKFRSLVSIGADDAIARLNACFGEHGVGYQFESGQLVRIDSQVAHAEVVKPTLLLLAQDGYEGANQEYQRAHAHYRNGRYPECLNECLKAFESTMKAICARRGWAYEQNHTARKLIAICFEHELVPSFLQSQFSGWRTLLESGVPAIRNKLSAHGQGVRPTEVPEHLASYALHLTAANILFLVRSEQALP